jgi:pentapeptide MXKDX repeat protein
MRKFLITAGLVLAVATPALAQGMAGPSASGDGMAGPSHMAMGNDGMKMDHKKKPKKAAMAHDAMAAPASGSMSGPSSNSMSGPGH